MTTQKRREANEGSAYWMQYVKLNGYAFYPTRKGLEKLSQNLDLSISYLSRSITAYLQA